MLERKRPMNLNLMTIRFPVTAIVSILHRISGILIFLFLPFGLWLLDLSLSSSQGFALVGQLFNQSSIFCFIIWLGLVAFSYHFFAGIRHLIMDMGFSDSLKGGRLSAWIILIATFIAAILLGVWLW